MPESYTRKPSYIAAHQFEGWPDAVVIQQWIPGTVFVPRGYEHHMRTQREHDTGTDRVLEDARPYLVFKLAGEYVRVDLNTWIVLDENGNLEFVIPADFAERFERAAAEHA